MKDKKSLTICISWICRKTRKINTSVFLWQSDGFRSLWTLALVGRFRFPQHPLLSGAHACLWDLASSFNWKASLQENTMSSMLLKNIFIDFFVHLKWYNSNFLSRFHESCSVEIQKGMWRKIIKHSAILKRSLS